MDILGIDVAKRTFVVTLLKENGEREQNEFSNDGQGFGRLKGWLQREKVKHVHGCMEATSVYWEELAEYLAAAGHVVSVVNPARIKGYAQSQLRRHKTDKVDSDVIADFCQTHQPAAWQAPTESERKLKALVRHAERVKGDRARQKNRLESCRDAQVKASLKRTITFLTQELKALEQEIEETIDQDPDMKERAKLLLSITGFGKRTVSGLMAEMPDLEQYANAKAAAADAGVTPSHFESGDSVRRRPKVSKIGKASVRSKLFFPAMTAMRHNPLIQAFAERLQGRGKPQIVIIVAVMRKLLHIAYGVLKTRVPFDPNYLDNASHA